MRYFTSTFTTLIALSAIFYSGPIDNILNNIKNISSSSVKFHGYFRDISNILENCVKLAQEYFSDPESCDLDNPLKRNVNHYYGIDKITNPFKVLNAEKQDKDVPFYEPVLTESMKSASMVLIGDRGSGKSQIRKHLIKQINKTNPVILEFYGNNRINNYLKVFVIDSARDIIEKKFSNKDFMDIILAEMVDSIHKMRNLRNIPINSLPKYERISIAYLLSFYSADNYQKVEILNLILKDIKDSSQFNPSCEHQTLDSNNRFVNKNEFTKILKIFENVKILSENQKSQGASLAYCIYEATDVQPDILSLQSEFEKIFK